MMYPARPASLSIPSVTMPAIGSKSDSKETVTMLLAAIQPMLCTLDDVPETQCLADEAAPRIAVVSNTGCFPAFACASAGVARVPETTRARAHDQSVRGGT